ncbi:NADP-dependent oxidoreductase [Dactylosporangium vinaceum]|uniref:NADP-dependent oxidoreductase n=1 Tax=Dactylosporangium vinaceum TaxID=53362 RepID=A0ABV5M421_9ACTN|nr:NADP-dependent oxidoreductase [Dactylosporangium vinaceum]
MKAIRIHAYGDASVLRLDDIPVPEPAGGEVLVKVAGTSFNPSEIGLRNGWLRGVFDLRLPYTPGWDLAGTVVHGAGAFTAGQPVVGRVDGGAAAEYTVADPALLVPAPVTVPLAHAAALPVAGVTAWQALFVHAGRALDGARVFVNGAGGGIGGFAVQLAHGAGAHVTATASPRSAGTVREFGAAAVHDYAHGLPPGRFDVVLNLVPTDDDLAALVAPGGVLVSVTNPFAPPAVHFVVQNNPADLARLVGLVDAGDLRLDIAGVRGLAELPAVHRAAESGRLRGKTIITPSG